LEVWENKPHPSEANGDLGKEPPYAALVAVFIKLLLIKIYLIHTFNHHLELLK